MEKNSVSFSYGCLSETLEEQANKQGYTLGLAADSLEKLKKAALLCSVHLLPCSQSDKMFNKLHKKVMLQLSPLE